MKRIIALNILQVLLVPFIFAGTAKAESWTPGQWQKGTTGEIEYLTYVPKGYTGQSSSLMVNLHGCNQTPEHLQELGNWEGAADRYQMIVVLPRVPRGGVYYGCWDYYGTEHDENSRFTGPLIRLTEFLVNKSGLKIDTRKIYASGLSSGSAQAMLLGCIRPDLFAGIGLNAGPVIGSEANELQHPKIDAQGAAELCRKFAGSRSTYLRKQVTSIIFDEADYIVNHVHGLLSLDALAEVYGATSETTFDLSMEEGANTEGVGHLFKTASGVTRLSFIVNAGLGHAWPSGTGQQSVAMPPMPLFARHWINGNSINYPMYLGKFFSENNTRK